MTSLAFPVFREFVILVCIVNAVVMVMCDADLH